jgi:hypothetical protein
MSRGKHLSLEEARKDKKLEQKGIFALLCLDGHAPPALAMTAFYPENSYYYKNIGCKTCRV